MRETTQKTARKRKGARRHPLATVALIAIGLGLTGGAYAAFNATGSSADATASSQSDIDAGKRLFQANCASCHGLEAQGTSDAPSLIGVGAAAVDFQVGTGRMPMSQPGAQALKKKPVYDEDEIRQLAAFVASLGPGPAIPTADEYDPKGLSDDEIARGGEFFRTNCTACHNFAGHGGAMPEGKFAPNLSKTTPKHVFEAMMTGPQQMPVFSNDVLSPQDKKEIIGYIKAVNDQTEYGGFSLGSLGPVSEGMFAWIVGIGGLIIVATWIAAHTAKSKKKAEADA
jgi:ubiquinol-cytochrome c reductase cytochrome c subunit